MASHHMTASVAPTTQPQTQPIYFHENNNYYEHQLSAMHYGHDMTGQQVNMAEASASPTRRRASPVTSGQAAQGNLEK